MSVVCVCVCPCIAYRRRLIFWGTTDGKVRTGSFVNRTKLNDIKDIQVINGPPYNHLFIGKL